MGNYLNPDINNFMEVVNSSIYVDKTELLEYLNSIAQTTQKYICISRPRRFGKSMPIIIARLIQKNSFQDSKLHHVRVLKNI